MLSSHRSHQLTLSRRGSRFRIMILLQTTQFGPVCTIRLHTLQNDLKEKWPPWALFTKWTWQKIGRTVVSMQNLDLINMDMSSGYDQISCLGPVPWSRFSWLARQVSVSLHQSGFRYHESGLAFSFIHCYSNLRSTANLLRGRYVLG